MVFGSSEGKFRIWLFYEVNQPYSITRNQLFIFHIYFKSCLFRSHFTPRLSTICPHSQLLLSCNLVSCSLLIIAACWKTLVSHNMATVCKKHQKIWWLRGQNWQSPFGSCLHTTSFGRANCSPQFQHKCDRRH